MPPPDAPTMDWPTPETAVLPTPAPTVPTTPAQSAPTVYRNLTVTGNFLGEASVTGGRWSTVPVVSGSTYGAEIPANSVIETRLEINPPLTAPLTAGQKIGAAVFLMNGAELGRVDALCGESVPLPLPTPEQIAAIAAATQAGMYDWERLPA